MDLTLTIALVIGVTLVVCGIIALILRWVFVTSTDGVIKRFENENAKAQARQNELTQKLKKADEDLAQRQAEAKELADKMRQEAEESSKKEREEMIQKARAEGEEIIEKAKKAQEKMKIELEREMDIKAVNFGMEILNEVFNEKTRGEFNQYLINDFVNTLKDVDMSKINPDIAEAQIVSLGAIDSSVQSQVESIVKEKLNRPISFKAEVDTEIGGGIIIKFGSMSLDGSLRSLMQEKAKEKQNLLEQKVIR